MTTALAQIPAGSFIMGVEDAPHPEDGEGPPREVVLPVFEIGAATVTNLDFDAFVSDTKYKTLAESRGGSLVFSGQLKRPAEHEIVDPKTPWWRWVEDASWRKPAGADSPNDPALPAVHIAFDDALAYCDWANVRLPTEAEWERAARGGLHQQPFPNGEDAPDINIWRGKFPDAPKQPPGPVAANDGTPNAFGLHHACGNVWEWCADRFTRLHSPRAQHNPQGPLNGSTRVVRGGSFLCCASYCARYRTSSRRGEVPELTASNLGFRIARSV